MALREHARALIDVKHALGIVALCGQHAAELEDRKRSASCRPELLVAQARAQALEAMGRNAAAEALDCANEGLYRALIHYRSHKQPRGYEACPHVRELEELRAALAELVNPDSRRMLRHALRAALRNERFEEAARLRDEIRRRGQ
jgi:hypothetical protein